MPILFFLDNPRPDFTSVYGKQKALITGKHSLVDSNENQFIGSRKGVQKTCRLTASIFQAKFRPVA